MHAPCAGEEASASLRHQRCLRWRLRRSAGRCAPTLGCVPEPQSYLNLRTSPPPSTSSIAHLTSQVPRRFPVIWLPACMRDGCFSVPGPRGGAGEESLAPPAVPFDERAFFVFALSNESLPPRGGPSSILFSFQVGYWHSVARREEDGGPLFCPNVSRSMIGQ